MRPKGAGKVPGSGRKKGTPNKSTIPLRQKAEELGVDPFEVLLLFTKADWKALGYQKSTETKYKSTGESYEAPLITPDHRIKAAAEACQYLHPKLKQIETTNKPSPLDDRPLEDMSDEELQVQEL